MLSDIEIAQQANMKKITEVAASLGISEDDIEPYGHYKAKLSEKLFAETANKPDGKLILVSAINPTRRRGQDHHFRRSYRGYGKDRQKGCTRSP